MIAIVEAVNYTAIPNFVPSGVLWFAEDTGDLWIGTGSSEPPKVLQIAGSGGSPGGFNGDLQYNNNGSLGGSAATTDAEGDITVPGFLSVASTLFDQTGSAGQTGQFLQTTVNGVLWATASGGGGSPGGSSGDIQFNSGSSFGGSTATITSTGSITIPVNSDLFWGNDTQISRISGGTLSIGVGAHGDETGSLILNNIHLGAGLYDGTGNIGSNNNLLGSTGSKIAWTSAPSVASITSTTATITNAFITTATVTTATISGNGYVSTLVSPAATITTLTVTTATVASGALTIQDIAANPDLILFNTTASTVTSTNQSPTLEYLVNYATTTTQSGLDKWTIGSVLSAGVNGTSKLTFAHSGTTNVASVDFPTGNLTFAADATVALNSTHNGTTYEFQSQGNTTVQIEATTSVGGAAVIVGLGGGPGGYLALIGNLTSQAAVNPCVALGNVSSVTGASGSAVGVNIGGNASAALTFNPTSGSMSITGLLVAPTIEGTTSGATTALYVNPTTTLTNLSGTNLLAKFANAGVQAAAIDYSGNYYSGSTVGVSAGPFAAITSIQTVGGIVTTLADVSDERLKDHTPYIGGLAEILSITPVKYTWNVEGRRITGFSEDRQFVGFRAQDVKAAIPEAVSQSVTNPEYFGFDDRPVIAALVNSVKELSARVKELEQLRAGKKAEE